MVSAKGERRYCSAYITVIDQDQSIFWMCRRKERDAHACSTCASTPDRAQQTLLQARCNEASLPMPEVGKMQVLEKVTKTIYGKTAVEAGKIDTMLDT